jgi:hypothetical protein
MPATALFASSTTTFEAEAAPAVTPAVVFSSAVVAVMPAIVIRSDSSRGPRSRVVQFAMPGSAPVGSIVEVRLDGWYATGLPRFPRLVRSRGDLSCGGVTLCQ